MNKLIEINPIQARLEWPAAEAHLREALDDLDKDHALTCIKARIFAGLDTLWRIDDKNGEVLAWSTTQIYTADGITNVAQISIACTRDMKLFIKSLNEFEVWAHKHDAHYIEIVGRQGWTRVMKPLGFTHNYTSLTKRIFRELH